MHENDGRVVSNFVLQALRHEPITLYGDGLQTRSFCFVSDLVSGLIGLMNLDSDPGPVNLGNPRESTIRELADIIMQLTRSKTTLVHKPLPVDDPMQRCPDIAKARELLAWQPAVPLEVGLAKTIEYFSRITSSSSIRPS
jgi:UDP-glucuronate decarboxylase